MGRDTSRGKVAYSWISSDPAKAGPTLGGIVVVVVVVVDLAKLTQYPKPEPNDPDPYLTQHPKYVHPKVDPKPELTRIEPYSTRNFSQSCLF